MEMYNHLGNYFCSFFIPIYSAKLRKRSDGVKKKPIQSYDKAYGSSAEYQQDRELSDE